MSTLARLTTVLILLLSSVFSLAAELDGSLDEDVNPHLDDEIAETAQAVPYASQVESYSAFDPGFFSPVIGADWDVIERARMVVSYPSTMFTLLPEQGNPHGIFAFSAFNFQSPRTGEWKNAVLLLSLKPGLKGKVLGEAHFPPKLSEERIAEALANLESRAIWSTEALKNNFGRQAFHF